jgi:hypothetical protein
MNNVNKVYTVDTRRQRSKQRHNSNIISKAAFRNIFAPLMVWWKGTLLAGINGKGALENIDMNSYCYVVFIVKQSCTNK